MRLALSGFMGSLAVALAVAMTGQADTLRVIANGNIDGDPDTFETVSDAFTEAKARAGNHTIELEYLGALSYFDEPEMDFDHDGDIEIVNDLPAGGTIEIYADGNHPVFRNTQTTGRTLAIRGASESHRITLRTGYGTPVIDCGNAAGSGVVILENVSIYKEVDADDGVFLQLDNRPTDAHTLTNVQFSGGDPLEQHDAVFLTGPRHGMNSLPPTPDLPMSLELDNVDFHLAEGDGDRIQIYNIVDLSAVDCVFAPGPGGSPHRASAVRNQTTTAADGGSLLVFRDCTFESGDRDLFPQMGNSTNATPNQFLLYRPVFTGKCGNTAAFNIGSSGAELQILGLDDGDQPFEEPPGSGNYYRVDMDPIADGGTYLWAMLLKGRLIFEYAQGTKKPAEEYAIASRPGNLENDVWLEMISCDWDNGAGTYYCGADGGAFAPRVTTFNTMFRGGHVDAYLDVSGSHTGQAIVHLKHTTLTSPASDAVDMLVKGNPGDVLYGAAALFDARGDDGLASTSNLFLDLRSTFNWMNLAWDADDPNGWGGFTIQPNSGVILADPKLDPATGKLTNQSGAAMGTATGSPIDVDYEGDARPLPDTIVTPPDIGADEAQFGPTDVQWSTHPVDPTIGDSAANGSPVGTLVMIDPDTGDTATFQLMDDAGGRFTLVGDEVQVLDGSLLDAGDGFYTIEVQAKDSMNTWLPTAVPLDIDVTDTTAPTVSNVVVIGAHQIRVTFSEAMAAAALNPANYTLSGPGAGSFLPAYPNPDTVTAAASPPAAENSYDLTWACGGTCEMLEGGAITITVDASVEDISGNPMGSPDFGTDPMGGVGILPTLAFIEVQGPDVVHATFSEPMSPSAESAFNYTLTGDVGTLAATPDTATFLQYTTYALEWSAGAMSSAPGASVTLLVISVSDLAGNPISTALECHVPWPDDVPFNPDPRPCNQYGTSTVTTPPSVVSIVAVAQNAIEITFSEPMSEEPAVPYAQSATNPANYTLLDGLGVSGAGSILHHPTDPPKPQPDSVAASGSSSYILTWDDREMYDGGNIVVEVNNDPVSGLMDLAGTPIDQVNPFAHQGFGTGLGVAPTVSEVWVIDERHMAVLFSETMAAGLTTPGKYELSGPGQGALDTNPDAVANPLADHRTFELSWNSGALVDGQDVTITVLSLSVYDLAGNPLGLPASGAATDRIAITGITRSTATPYLYVGDPYWLRAETTGGAGALTYRWEKDGAPFDTNPSYTQQTLSFAGLAFDDRGSYMCYVSDTRIEEVDSPAVSINAAYPMEITQQPQSGTADLHDEFTFSVEVAYGFTPLTYQWKQDDADVGASSSDYVIDAVEAEDAGEYYVEVYDQGGTNVVSDTATLTVISETPAGGFLGLGTLALAISLGAAAVLRRRR